MHLNSETLAQTRQTWRNKPVRELLAQIISANPGATENALRKLFRKEGLADDDYTTAIFDYAFDAAYRAYQRQARREPPTAQQKAAAAAHRAVEAAEHAKKVEQRKDLITLLNQEMPNGKRARNCTLDYMYRLGGAYRRIGKQGVHKLVGSVYNEDEYRKKLQGVS